MKTFSLTDLPVRDIHLHTTTVLYKTVYSSLLSTTQTSWSTPYKAIGTDELSQEKGRQQHKQVYYFEWFYQRDDRVKALAPKQHHCFTHALAPQFCFAFGKERMKKSREAQAFPPNLIILSKVKQYSSKNFDSLFTASQNIFTCK